MTLNNDRRPSEATLRLSALLQLAATSSASMSSGPIQGEDHTYAKLARAEVDKLIDRQP